MFQDFQVLTTDFKSEKDDRRHRERELEKTIKDQELTMANMEL